MKNILPFTKSFFFSFLFFIPSTVFTMEEKDTSVIQEIEIKQYRSAEDFFDIVQERPDIDKPYSRLYSGSQIISYHHNNETSKSRYINHGIIHRHNPTLTVYFCTTEGQQEAFIGNADMFFENKKPITKPIALAVAIVQSAHKKDDLFNKINSKLKCSNLRKYWVKTIPETGQQSLAVILKPENQSYMLLQDGQIIKFYEN